MQRAAGLLAMLVGVGERASDVVHSVVRKGWGGLLLGDCAWDLVVVNVLVLDRNVAKSRCCSGAHPACPPEPRERSSATLHPTCCSVDCSSQAKGSHWRSACRTLLCRLLPRRSFTARLRVRWSSARRCSSCSTWSSRGTRDRCCYRRCRRVLQPGSRSQA